jgi:hypothetical protein
MDYQNGKIYVIRNHINDLVYIGATTQSLAKRFSVHKDASRRNFTIQLYKAFQEIGIENFYIELIENCPCNSKNELHAREGFYIRHFDSYINGYNARISGRNGKDYYNENKEIIAEKCKIYREANQEIIRERKKRYCEENKEKISQHNKVWREENKEIIKEKKKAYREANKDILNGKHKQDYHQNKEKYAKSMYEYYQKNSDEIKRQAKEYYETHKAEISQKNSVQIQCECGAIITKQHLARHKKSKKHLDKINENQL